MSPPCPTSSTAPGSLLAAIASLISLETVAKPGGIGASGGLETVGGSGGGLATGACVVCALLVGIGAGCADSPRAQAATNTSRTVATAMNLRIGLLPTIIKGVSDVSPGPLEPDGSRRYVHAGKQRNDRGLGVTASGSERG